MASLLLGQTLAQGLHQLVEAELLDLGPLLGAEEALGHAGAAIPPAVPWPRRAALTDSTPLKVEANTTSNLSRLRSSLTRTRARQAIEFVDRPFRQIAFQRPHQVEILARGDRDVRLPKVGEEGQEHRSNLARCLPRCAMLAPWNGIGHHGRSGRSTDLCLAARRRPGRRKSSRSAIFMAGPTFCARSSTRRPANRATGRRRVLVFLGDLVDRGPDSLGTVDLAIGAGAQIGADDCVSADGQPRGDDAARARSPHAVGRRAGRAAQLAAQRRRRGRAAVRQISRSSRPGPRNS